MADKQPGERARMMERCADLTRPDCPGREVAG